MAEQGTGLDPIRQPHRRSGANQGGRLTVGDITRLQTLLEKLPPSPALQQLKKFVEEERALLAAPRLHRAHDDLRHAFPSRPRTLTSRTKWPPCAARAMRAWARCAALSARCATATRATPSPAMELEHYPGMTEKCIEAIIDARRGALWHLWRARDPPRGPAAAPGPDRAGGRHQRPPRR